MRAEKRGLIIVISGPSGVGKGTVIARLMSTCERLAFSVSATTRASRPGEIDGESYRFISREQFEALIRENKMLEYTVYNGNYYGTPASSVEDVVNTGKSVILDIEVEGAFNIKRLYPEAITIFLLPPSEEELLNRLRGRNTETEQQIKSRMARAREELALASKYDYAVVSGEIEKTAEDIKAIMKKRGFVCE